jgi:Cu/Ag efflux pump CusA
MWIVRLALRRPYTFIVLAILLFILGPLAIMRTPTDIFPNIDIPVVDIVWSYNGFSAEDMVHRNTSNMAPNLTSWCKSGVTSPLPNASSSACCARSRRPARSSPMSCAATGNQG